MHDQHRQRRGRRGRVVAAVAAVAVAATGCQTDNAVLAPRTPSAVRPLPDAPAEAAFAARGSVRQVTVTGAEGGEQLALFDRGGRAVALGAADRAGALVFREVRPGAGYRVGTATGDALATRPVEVLTAEQSLPPQSFYDRQRLRPGLNYITTRDGTTLSAFVYLPGPPEKGPYPTVVEYSGYNPSKPGNNLLEGRGDDLGIDPDAVCGAARFVCDGPAQPSSLLAAANNYAVVGVNVRGTGCSGGSYDFFEELQLLDGYDVIETVAAQPWVKGGKVGMVGLSYPGLSQIFVASTQPPSLASIAPLSVTDDTVRGLLAPGGIFNEGFALQWAENVLDGAAPYGQGWERAVVDGGDEECAANQRLRGQNVDTAAKAQRYRYYDPAVADPYNLSMLAAKVEVPVFLTGANQDEQTGGRYALLFDKFTASPSRHFTTWNGVHGDGFAPHNLVEWKTFLDLYVNRDLTPVPAGMSLLVPLLSSEVFGASVDLPPLRFDPDAPFAATLAEWESEPEVRVLFESGAGDPAQPGAPVGTLDLRVDTYPLPGTTAQAWYFQPDGTMAPERPGARGGASRWTVAPELAAAVNVEPGADVFDAQPAYRWEAEPEGASVAFVTPPLEKDLVLAGSASADLWVRSSAPVADLGVTLSEVRPDGDEVYVQSGVLRGEMRKVAAGSTELLPLHTGLERDAAPMPVGRFTEARVEVFPFHHVVRAGSRLRISVHTPGGDRSRWTYILDPTPDGATVDVGHSAAHPSRLVLPVAPGVDGYPAEAPPCQSLRGQPCRRAAEVSNRRAP